MRFFRIHGSILTLGIALALTIATPLLERVAYSQATTASGAIQ